MGKKLITSIVAFVIAILLWVPVIFFQVYIGMLYMLSFVAALVGIGMLLEFFIQMFKSDKISSKFIECPACHAMISSKNSACPQCGEVLVHAKTVSEVPSEDDIWNI